MLNAELTKTERQIKSILSGPALGELGRKTGFVQRRREVTTLGFVASLLKSLATRKIESMADLCRDFNADHDKTINYKPYYNRLDSPGFPKLMATLFEDMMSTLYHQALKPLKCGPFAAFKDIVIHDGTSFQLHDDLAKIFPGRFTTISPAAVELHVTMSLFYDQPICVVATGDKECERHYAPEAKDLSGKLFLADRGYDSTLYMTEIDSAGGKFVIRTRKCLDPVVIKIHRRGSKFRALEGLPLHRVLAELSTRAIHDLEVGWEDGHGFLHTQYRLLVRWHGPEKEWIRLMTNLPRDDFSACDILTTYRLRWQVELLFKEHKSYANLHMFSTVKSTIAEGLFWAALCAAFLKRYFAHTCQRVSGRTPISTRRVAMSSHVFMDRFCACWLRGFRGLTGVLVNIVTFLEHNAKRSNPGRERTRGRLTLGLETAGVSGEG